MMRETTQTQTDGSQQEATSAAELRKQRLRWWTRLPWGRHRPGVHARPMFDLDLDLTFEDLMGDLDPGWSMRRDVGVTERSVRTETTTSTQGETA